MQTLSSIDQTGYFREKQPDPFGFASSKSGIDFFFLRLRLSSLQARCHAVFSWLNYFISPCMALY